ncbi:MAG: pyridoxal phosphate-dependent decarboxylase family protein [Pseudonocardiaceae bacterium]
MKSDFDLSPAQLEDLLSATTLRILQYQRDLSEGKYPASYIHDSINVANYSEGKHIGAQLREDEVPQIGTSIDVLLGDIFDRAMTNGTMHAHPGFLAHVPSGGLFQAAVGEFIARSLNRFIGVWAAAPGFTEIESNVIKWFCNILGYGDQAFGYLTTGGSIANFMALRCALEQLDEAARPLATIYVSDQGHFSVEKAAKLAGISRDRVRIIGTHSDHSINTDELAERIKSDKFLGFYPACVVATAGTTNTGAVDNLGNIAACCRKQNIWLHVDACFGGFFRLTARGKEILEGIELAESISVDAHKSLFMPHGTSALLVKERAHLRDTFEIPGASYIPGLTNGDDLVDFCNYGPELSREVRGFTAWLPIKMHGIRAFERCLDQKLDQADYLAESLLEINGTEIVKRGSPHLPVVAFKLRGDSRAEEDQMAETLCELICSRSNVYLTTTRLPQEGLVLRACILHHQTNKGTIDQVLEDMRWSIKNMK